MMQRSTQGNGVLVKTLQPTMLRVNKWGGVGKRDFDYSHFDAEPWEGPLPPPPPRYSINASVLSDAMEKLIVDAGASGLHFWQARSVNPNINTDIARSLHLKVRLFGEAGIPKANTALIKGTVVERAIILAPEYGVGLSFGLLHLYHLLHPSDLHVDYDKLAILRGLMPLFGDVKGLVEVLSRGDRCARKALRVWIIARGTMMFTETIDLVGGRAADAQMLDAEGLEASSARSLRHGMAMDVILEAAKALGRYARWTFLIDWFAAPRASNLPYDVALQGAKLMRKLEIDAMPEPCAPLVCFAFDDALEARIVRLADRDAALVLVDTEASSQLVALARAYMATASRHVALELISGAQTLRRRRAIAAAALKATPGISDEELARLQDQVLDKFVADDDEKAARAAAARDAKAAKKAEREAMAAAAKAAREATAAKKKAERDATAAKKKFERDATANFDFLKAAKAAKAADVAFAAREAAAKAVREATAAAAKAKAARDARQAWPSEEKFPLAAYEAAEDEAMRALEKAIREGGDVGKAREAVKKAKNRKSCKVARLKAEEFREGLATTNAELLHARNVLACHPDVLRVRNVLACHPDVVLLALAEGQRNAKRPRAG